MKNVGPLVGATYTTSGGLSEEMYYFDRLPPRLREAINQAPLMVSAKEAYEYLQKGIELEALQSRKQECQMTIGELKALLDQYSDRAEIVVLTNNGDILELTDVIESDGKVAIEVG